MLDNITKKNIDDCRDVLVGKVPDPKSQIEQITLALIYKFMDDMDKEAVEKFKGKAKFFTGTYSKYGWRKLFDPSLSGAEMLALYSEALEKLNTNPNIPELFRNIFKNAYLPYRDPSTLKLFLKYINEFDYSHSEKLGDAFEYLLSVMGSQGDAGQFRTPRHIIDFVTACVNPQKNETVLDPACGTAGFLLSAYKHILKQNTDKRHGDKLTPDQRKKLAVNFVGYDISPDMVRLSLANMYLHGFATPQIHEYDSLSSEDRWNETFDVILANPPFMTPKGGIRPHKKFGVQANKAEVLFTDYIGEHLNSNGRAGIIVPNGIVATTQTAYKQLRKLLVEDSLIAVISLPAGVFQPYSGVKTSVLLLDKQLAKKSKHILFLKIDNDGFDLGAQRKEIEKNDLPTALAIITNYKLQIANDETLDELQSLATLVERKAVLTNKDIALSADRFLTNQGLLATEFEMKPISNFVVFSQTGIVRNRGEQNESFTHPYLKMDKITTEGRLILDKLVNVNASIEELEKYSLKKGDFLYNTRNTPDLVGKSAVFNGDENKYLFNNNIMRIRFDERLNPFFLNLVLNTEEYKQEIKKFVDGTTSVAAIYPKNYFSIEIPLPPLSIQQQMVTEIEGYQKIIDGAKQVVNNYKPTIAIKPEWEMVELGSIAKIKGGYAFKSDEFTESGIQVLKISNVKTSRLVLDKNPAFMQLERKKEFEKYLISKGDILITMTGTEGKRDYGDVCLVTNNGEFLLNQRVGKVDIISELINKEYLSLAMMSPTYQNEIFKKATGVRQSNVSGTDLEEIKIPLPAIEEQIEIVKRIVEEQALVNATKKLIEIFEQKVKDKINEVWGVKEGSAYKIEQENLSMAAEPEPK